MAERNFLVRTAHGMVLHLPHVWCAWELIFSQVVGPKENMVSRTSALAPHTGGAPRTLRHATPR
jgi:hypothetical protein